MTATDPILSTRPAPTPDLALRLKHMSPVITVIGDPMLDGWWRGSSTRMAREAPAPVVRIADRQFVPGGAANTAMNLASLGARVRFVGLVGDDDAGRRLRDLMDAEGIDVTALLLEPGIRTISKDRIVVGDQVLARLDDGHTGGYPLEARQRLADAALRATADVAVELICDYAVGTLDGPVREALLARSSRPELCVVDARDPRLWAGLRPELVTPNSDEVGVVLDETLERDSDRVRMVIAGSDRLLAGTGARAVVATLDRDGTVLLAEDGTLHRTWTRPATDKQASGAGDTFVAALTVARACGLPLTTSADLAQAAADVVVGRFGTSVCSADDLAEHLARGNDSAVEPEDLVRRIAGERAAGKRIVLTNGCFDVLHRGHTASLNQAKRLGDVLVVAINSDDSVRRLKGPERPINAAADRAGVLAALSCVDYVTVFETDTPIPLIERLRPDVYAKGGDYTVEQLPESPVVHGYGGEVRILEFVPDKSTTAVVDRIRAGREARVAGLA